MVESGGNLEPMKKWPIRIQIVLLSLAVLTTYPGAASPQDTLKVDTTLVTLTATVTGDSGRQVAGLEKEDFSVFEDDVRQEVSFFTDERVPMSVGIVFDTSGSMVDKLEDVQDAVKHFIDILRPGDEIFLIQFSSRVDVVTEFTDDRRQLYRAVERLHAAGSTSLYDALQEAFQKLSEGRNRKKAILLISDGNDTSSHTTEREVKDLARKSEVLLYAVGIGHGERGSFGHAGRADADIVDSALLRSFADPTGGRSVVIEGAHHVRGIDRIDQAIQGIANELTQQYSLGYYPTNAKKDGSYRRINVDVSRPGLNVKTRNGYWARDTGE